MIQKIKVVALPEGQQRIETGAVQFIYPLTEEQKSAGMPESVGEDWPSYNMRGDNSFGLSIDIHCLEEAIKKIAHLIPVEDLNMINWHLRSISSWKDDIVSNTIVGGKERFPDL